MSGNLAGWQPKTIKKDEKGNWVIFGKYTISGAAGALILAIAVAFAQYFGIKLPSIPTSNNNQPRVVSVERAEEQNSIMSHFSATGIHADLIVPTGNVDVYKLVKIKSDKLADYYDLLVMTIYAGNIEMVDVVATSAPGEWVFTGPPGRYSIRLTSFDTNKGFHAVTGTVIIGGVIPVPTPTPTPTPNPVPTPTPTPDPSIPVGKYGFGPAMYKVVSEQVAADVRVKYAGQVADAFEGVAAGIAAGSFTTPTAANTELAGRNRLIFASDPTALEKWKPFFAAWSAKATELNKAGTLPNIAAEYAVAYKETMVGLRAIK